MAKSEQRASALGGFNFSKPTLQVSVTKIPIELLDEDPENDVIYNMDGIEALAMSISETGITEPIVVYKKPGSDRYLIRSGHRRRRAALLAGLDLVPVIIKEWEPDEKQRVRNLIESNLDNRTKTPMAIAREIDRYMSCFEGIKKMDLIETLSKRLGKSTATIRRYLSLLDFIKPLQEKVDKENIYSMAAITEARAMSTEQQETFNSLIDDFVQKNGEDKVTKDILVDIARTVKNNEVIQKAGKIKKQKPVFTVKTFKKNTKKFLDYCKLSYDCKDTDTSEIVSVLEDAKKQIDEYLSTIKQ